MTDEAFLIFKNDMLQICDNATNYDYKWERLVFTLPQNPQEWLDLCAKHFSRLGSNAPRLKGFKYCNSSLTLCNYKYPLPEGFEYCNGDLDLSFYEFSLPNSFTHCKGFLNVKDYGYMLPSNFATCVGMLYNSNYYYKMPKNFQVIAIK